MNVLVTGANGQLGNELRIAVAESPKVAGYRFLFTDITETSDESVAMLHRLGGAGVDVSTRRLDITDPQAVRAAVREFAVDAIVNCAAYTNVDAAESHPEAAELLNARAPRILAEAMRETGGLLVHVSTDYVFGGKPCNTPICEDCETAPTGAYGLTKLHGEQAVQSSGCRYVILRTAWLYSEFGRNFLRTMLRLTAEKPSLKVVFDQVGTPTYAGDLAAAIIALLGHDGILCHSERSDGSPCGIYHYSDEGVCSWFDFAKTIAAYAGRTGCEIQPCHSDEFPSPVRRPAYSVLDKTLVKRTFGLSIPYWTDSLRRCLSSLIDKTESMN